MTDSPFIPCDSTPSAPPLENEEGSNIGGNKPEGTSLVHNCCIYMFLVTFLINSVNDFKQ